MKLGPAEDEQLGSSHSEPDGVDKRRTRLMACGGALLLGAAFVLHYLLYLNQRGVLHSDAAFFASTAKNLANAKGYASSLSVMKTPMTLRPFDPYITTGPTLILPVSLAVALLGNAYWVPGFAHILVWFLLLVGCALSLRRFGVGLALAGAAFLLSIFALSSSHHIQWFSALGEVPAGLLLILGAATWSAEPLAKKACFLAGTFWSLAVLSKLMAAIAILVLVLLAFSRGRRVFLVAGLAWPLLLFEGWKLLSLGIGGYQSNWKDYLRYILASGKSHAAVDVSLRVQTFYQNSGGYLPLLVITALVGALTCWRIADPRWKRLTFALFSAACAHTFYWLFFSNGWYRYYYIGLILLVGALVAPLLLNRRQSILHGALLYVVLCEPLVRSPQPLQFLFSHRSDAAHAKIVAFLREHRTERPFAAVWWASVAELEYLLPNELWFEQFEFISSKTRAGGVLFVTASGLEPKTKSDALIEFEKTCGPPILTDPPFSVLRCKSPLARGTEP